MSFVWFIAEWLGVALALAAAFLISKNTGKDKLAWYMFIVADTMHASYYYHHNQNGLVANQLIGLCIAVLGLVILAKKSDQIFLSKINLLMVILSYSFAIAATGALAVWVMAPNVKNFEWVACFISLMGTTLLASKHETSKYGFFMWLFCDLTLMYVAIINSQFGIVLLRLIYTMIDINGIKKWFFVNGMNIRLTGLNRYLNPIIITIQKTKVKIIG